MKAIGIVEISDFDPDQEYLIDLDLWQPNPEQAQLFTTRVAHRLDDLGGTLVNEYRGASALLVRMRGSGAVVREILELPEVAVANPVPLPDLLDAPDRLNSNSQMFELLCLLKVTRKRLEWWTVV